MAEQPLDHSTEENKSIQANVEVGGDVHGHMGVTQTVFNGPVGAQHLQVLRSPESVTFSLLKRPVDSRILIMGNLDIY
jgi:hypothetical protein